MFDIERLVIATALMTLLMACIISIITDHLLQLKIDISIEHSYFFLHFMDVCCVIFDISILGVLTIGIVKLVMWGWSLII